MCISYLISCQQILLKTVETILILFRAIILHLNFYSTRLGVLTHSAGTRPARLTCEGENMCSCCRQEMALDWTRESGLACITPHPTIQLERRAETAAPSSGKTHTNTSLLHLQMIKHITPKPLLVTQTHQSRNTLQVWP